MQARAAFNSFCWPLFLLAGCISSVAQPVPPTPSIQVQVTLSPAAAERMNSLPSEQIIVTANYSGAPRGSDERGDHARQINLGSQRAEISARAQIVRIDGPHLTPEVQAKFQGPILLDLEVMSASRRVPDKILSCEPVEKHLDNPANQPVGINCGLTTENNGPRSQSGPLKPIPPELAADTYAIYSLLLPGASADQIARAPTPSWSLAGTSVNITDMNPAVPPNGELKAPPENARAFNQAVLDFNARKYQRFRLDANSFHPARPFPLIDEHQVSSLRNSNIGNAGIIFFSAVYFSNARNAALVYVNDWCAHLCSAGQWVYLEKRNGQWVRRSGINANGA